MSKLKGYNPYQSTVNCIDPQIIVNPKVSELVFKFGNFVLNGRMYRYGLNALGVETFDLRRFHPHVTGVSLQNLDEFFIVDMRSGELYPIYFVVPCGHCLVCQDTKTSSFCRRCQYESQLYDCPPVHITITYDAAHLPDDKSVSVRDVQLWKKRFRICLERSNYGEFVDGVWHSRQLRICVAAEYGKKNTRRPHYHVLIWNLKPIGRFTYDYLRSLAWSCWNSKGVPKCDRLRFTLMPIDSNYKPKGCNKTLAEMGKTMYQAFGYVAKYFYKQDASSVPPGCRPLFHLMSKTKGLGGIGAPFIDKHAPRLRKRLLRNPQFLEKWSQKAVDMQYDRYFLNRVFPSRYSAVPYRVRKNLRLVCRYIHNCFEPDIINSFAPLQVKLQKLYPVLVIQKSPDSFCFRGRVSCSLIRTFSRRVVMNAISSLVIDIGNLDIADILNVDSQRKLIISKLFYNKKTQDVYRKYQKIVRKRHRRMEEFTQL